MPPVDGRFIDQDGEQDFTDDNGISLFIDQNGIYLGIGTPDEGGGGDAVLMPMGCM
jgi:hypothetical protein